MEQYSGDRETPGTPTTPSTPLTTPITPASSNPPSPMMMNWLKSSQSGSFPGSPIAAQPPQLPREKFKHGQATIKDMFTAESIATSQVKQHVHVPPPKRAYKPDSKATYVLSSESLPISQKEQQQSPQAIASSALSMSQEQSTTTSCVAKIAVTENATKLSASAGISACSANMTTHVQQATPTRVSQTSVNSSPTVKSTSSSELTQSRNALANAVITQPQVAKQIANTLSAAALTRSPLRHQKTSSMTDSAVSQSLTKQPPKFAQAQSTLSASSTPSVSIRNAQQSAPSVTGTQPQKSSTSQPLLQQSRPIMSPTVSQNQPAALSSSMPNTSVAQVRNIQQNASSVAAAMQAQNVLSSQASLLPQQIPVMVGLEYPPTLQQLHTLAMMGVQVPMFNLPLILQHPNQQSIAASVSNSAAYSEAAHVSMQSAAKQPETYKTGGSTATKTAAQSKLQQNITATSSSINVSHSVTASRMKGTNTTQKSNQEPSISVASSNIATPTSVGVTVAQSTPHTSAEHTKLTTEKGVTIAQKTSVKSHTSGVHTKLTTSTSEKSVIVAHKTPSKSHTSVEHTKRSLPTSSSNSQAQDVTYLFTDTISASTTTAPICTNSLPAISSSDSPAQRTFNATNTTPTASKTAPMKSGGRTASKQAAQPICHNSTPMTSTHTNSVQTGASSLKSIIQHVPQSSLSAKKSLHFSGSANTSSSSNHGGLPNTPTSSRTIQNSPASSLKGAAPKLSVKAENSTHLTSASSNGQKVLVNTVQSLLCTICQRTPRNPLRSECCGALYCEPCSRRIDRCPQHRCQLRLTRDMELFNVIQKQETKCKYAGNGCTWRGRVAEHKQHIMVCLYNPSSESKL